MGARQMKFTQSWLKRFLDYNATAAKVCEALTEIGIEMEKLVDRTQELSPFITAEILEIRKHPDADKLNLCTVNYGSGIDEIVCGAANIKKGLKVVLAPLGTKMPNSNIIIEKRKIRGIESVGMLCSTSELGISGDSEGILELPEDTKVGEKLLSVLPELADPLIEVEVTPNRSDCLGVYGIARDLAAYGMGSLKDLAYKDVKSSNSNKIKAIIEAEEKCSLFVTRYFSDIKNGQSDKSINSLLMAIGEAPISAVVDITNYMNYSFGRPMHAYDADKIKGVLRITELQSTEKFFGLDGKEYNLQPGDLVIKDDEKVCCIAGILGGENTKCDENTKNILLEAAVFDSVTITKMSRRLGIETRSKYVLERGVDHDFTLNAVAIASEMILSSCGGFASDCSFVGKERSTPKKICFNLDVVKKIAGLTLSEEACISILEKLGFQIEKESQGILQVTVPSWRHDISIKEDFVEEIARMYGFHNIVEKSLPKNSSICTNTVDSKNKLITHISSLLCFSGYDELITWSFMHSEDAKSFGAYDENLLIDNPISEELNILRSSILLNMLITIQKNNARSLDNLSFFEIGPVYNSKLEGRQTNVVSGVLSGQSITRSIYKNDRNFDFFDAKRAVLDVLMIFGIQEEEVSFSSGAQAWYHPGKSAVVKLDGKSVAYLGEIHPAILKKMKISKPTFGFEIFIDSLPVKNTDMQKFHISEYQPVHRDFAFVVDSNVSAESILKGIKSIDAIIKDVSIFDVYEGEKVGEGKKSIATNVIMQSNSATLNENDIISVSERIISYVKKKLGGTIRQS